MSFDELAPCCKSCSRPEKMEECSGCTVIYYCSDEHKRRDWSHHKTACRNIIKRRRNLETVKLEREATGGVVGDTGVSSLLLIVHHDALYHLAVRNSAARAASHSQAMIRLCHCVLYRGTSDRTLLTSYPTFRKFCCKSTLGPLWRQRSRQSWRLWTYQCCPIEVPPSLQSLASCD
jgi:hypothetical protein